jgi:hypothetical protein
MHLISLGKTQCFAGKASQTLPQGVEPTFNMVSFTLILVDLSMALVIEDMAVSLPFVAEGVAAGIAVWDLFPEMTGTGFRPIPKIRHDLVCATTQVALHEGVLIKLGGKGP